MPPQGFTTCWRSIAYIWQGRIDRLGALQSILGLSLFGFAMTLLPDSDTNAVFAAFWGLFLISLVLQVGVMISRVHDIGRSGLWMIPMLGTVFVAKWFGTPVGEIGVVAVAITYFLWPGEKIPNKWGDPGIGFARYWKRITGRDSKHWTYPDD